MAMGPAAPDYSTDTRTAENVSAIRHDTFTITCSLASPPSAVFEAFGDTPVRRRWFKLPGREVSARHDFTVNGGETASSIFATAGMAPEKLEFASRYVDIVPDARIVYAYTSAVNDLVRWASLVTIELQRQDGGTLLRWTEHAAFLTSSAHPEHDLPHLRGATRLRLNGLAAALSPT